MFGSVIVGALLAISHIMGMAAAQTSCPDIYVPIDGTCIHFVSQYFNWTESVAHCETLGGHLAVFSDCSLFGDVVKYMGAYNLDLEDYWVGATDIVEEGSWFWVNGEPVEMGSPFWGMTNSYFEPNDGTDSNCMVISRSDRYLFHDGECYDRFYSICQTNGTVDY